MSFIFPYSILLSELTNTRIEQKLNAGEEVDMPVFFFIDPDFLEDPQMNGIETITLSYTFFSKLILLYGLNGDTDPHK